MFKILLGGKMIVDNIVQERDVNASGSQISDDQNSRFFRSKFGGVNFSRRGVELRVDVSVADLRCVE